MHRERADRGEAERGENYEEEETSRDGRGDSARWNGVVGGT